LFPNRIIDPSMARHPVSRRVHRPPAQPDDIFVERVLATSIWARTHGKLIIAGAVVLVIAVIAFVVIRNTRANERAQAAIAMNAVRQSAQAGNPAVAIRDLQTFLSSYGDTPAGDEARLMLARAQLEANQPQQAVDAVAGEASDLGAPLGVQAAFLLGTAYENLNDYDQAEATYLRIGEGAPFDYQQAQGLENAARVRIERGNPAGAAELYDRLIALLPETSQERTIYEMRKAEALALANRPAGS
jgi:predicted negative regulator of RcsB-dependent stress response